MQKCASHRTRVCISRRLTKLLSAYIISTSLRRPREIGKDEEIDSGIMSRSFGLAVSVRLLYFGGKCMILFQRVKNANAEVRLPFIGDTCAVSARLMANLYWNMPGFCTQTSLRG